MLVELWKGLNMINVSKAIKELEILKEDYWDDDGYGHETKQYDDTMFAFDMAIRALEAQLHLNMYRDFDVCEWQEDYDWDENNISEYHSVASVNDFLIDELKG
jgi:hypothetical protein